VALLGPQEKAELEKLIGERLHEYYDRHGSDSLLAPGVSVAVDARGASIVPLAAQAARALACVEVRTLFTALCYAAAKETTGIPREALGALATEATSAAAAQINRIVQG